MEKLRYTDETDRCYGAAGMAISLVVFDGEDILSAISLDGPEGSQTMTLAPEFFFAGNPGVSAKTAWRQILKNYNLGIAMVTANLLCKNINYLTRVFTHRGVHTVAHDFASALSQRRSLSRLDALEMLQALQML